MNNAAHRIIRYAFTSRPENGVTIADGLTREGASGLAASLRLIDPTHAYGIRAASLEEQGGILSPSEALMEHAPVPT